MIEVFDREEDDFLAFWDQQRAQAKQATTRILGVDVVVPSDIPLGLQDLATELQDSTDPADIERLVRMLFGEGVYRQWTVNGLTVKMLTTLFCWGMANGAGKATTFAEAAELAAEAEEAKAKAEAEGKGLTPPNRANRRGSSKTGGSGATGRSSKQILRANTA